MQRGTECPPLCGQAAGLTRLSGFEFAVLLPVLALGWFLLSIACFVSYGMEMCTLLASRPAF